MRGHVRCAKTTGNASAHILNEMSKEDCTVSMHIYRSSALYYITMIEIQSAQFVRAIADVKDMKSLEMGFRPFREIKLEKKFNACTSMCKCMY
jgi:hypothetical protein